MKKLNLIIVFVALIFSVASAQKKSSREISKAIREAKCIAFEWDSAAIKAFEKRAYLNLSLDRTRSELRKALDGTVIYANSETTANKVGLVLSSKPSSEFYLVSPGTNSFLFQEIGNDQSTWITKKQFKNGLTTVSLDFEEGKFYNLRSKGGKNGAVNYYLEEWKDKDVEVLKKMEDGVPKFDPESQIETIKAFEAYTAEHPNRFDGTWSGKGGSVWAKYSSIQYTFDGNKIKYEVATKQYGGLALTVEAHILYNEDILVILPEKVSDESGKEVDYISMKPYICYYILNGNELNIEAADRDYLPGLWRVGGKFVRNISVE